MAIKVKTKNNTIILLFTSLLIFFTLSFHAYAQTILFDDFDSYPEGADLSGGGYGAWLGRWGTNITVSAEESVSIPHSAKMDNPSGCWESMLYQPIPYYPVIWFSADIMGIVSGRTGCHDIDALIRLYNRNQGGTWGSSQMFIMLMNGPGEFNYGPGLVAGTSQYTVAGGVGEEDLVTLNPNYQELAGQWINLMAKVDTPENQADVWVDGVYRASLKMDPACPPYAEVALDCGEGIGYIDNVHVFLDGPNPGDDAQMLQIGVPITEQTQQGQSHFFKLESEPGKDLIVTLDQQITGNGTLEFYGLSGKAPVRFRYDYHEESQNYQLRQTLYIPSSQDPVTYYFLVYDANSGSETSTFTISANYPSFSLSSITPTKGGNSGTVTIRFRGAGFTPETTAKLICSEGQEIIPENTNFANSTDMSATFDLTNKTPGACDVVLSKPGEEDIQITDGFTIEQGGEAKLWVEIVGPDAVRVGRISTFIIRYGNLGNVNADYPALIIGLSKDINYEIEGNFANVPSNNEISPISDDPEALSVTILELKDLPPYSARNIVVKVTAPVTGKWKFVAHITANQKIIYAQDYSFANSLFQDLIGVNYLHSEDIQLQTLPYLYEDPNFPHKDMSKTPPADYIMFWSNNNGTWHSAKSLGDGEFIEIMPDNDPNNPDINIQNLNDNPYSGWTYWGAYSLPNPVSKEELRNRVDKLRAKYGIDLEDPNKSKYTGKYCDSIFVKDELIKTYCWGLVLTLNFDNIYIDNKWLNPAEVYDKIKEKSEPTFYERMEKEGRKWPKEYTGDRCLKNLIDGTQAGIQAVFESIASIDPNDKAGPTGFDHESTPADEVKRFIANDHSLGYTIFFENLETATAAAQEVLITDHLDENFDWTTFSFGTMQVGEKIISVPEDSKNFQTTIDLRPDINALVDIDCNLTLATGVFECLFRGKDPDTDELADFLPPNTESVDPKGRGWISYSVKPKSSLSTGAIIKNKATIDFEVDIPPDPMETPEVFNTIDSGIPTSSVSPLPATQTALSFTVSWSGSDDAGGSGIKNYDIYASDNGGPYSLWLTTPDTSATFAGANGHQYSFYSRARDNVGNVEDAPKPLVPDATTTITGEQNIRVVLPNGGDVIPSGGIYGICWEAPNNSVKFNLKYSLNNGANWNFIKTVTGLNCTHWEEVPVVTANKKKCRVKVIGYDSVGTPLGEDMSDKPFTIEVVRVTSPNGRETLTSGNTSTIQWTTHKTIRPIAKTVLKYTTDGSTWKNIKTLTGNPGSYNWTVPNVSSTKCKVKVILKDANGVNIGTDVSDKFFTIQP